MNIYSKDLNLLVILFVLLEEKNLSAAAKRLGLSQPAMSHALNRLRNMMGDPLFTRASRGIIPTNFALKMVSKLKNFIMSQTEDEFIHKSFAADISNRQIRIEF